MRRSTHCHGKHQLSRTKQARMASSSLEQQMWRNPPPHQGVLTTCLAVEQAGRASATFFAVQQLDGLCELYFSIMAGPTFWALTTPRLLLQFSYLLQRFMLSYGHVVLLQYFKFIRHFRYDMFPICLFFFEYEYLKRVCHLSRDIYNCRVDHVRGWHNFGASGGYFCNFLQ